MFTNRELAIAIWVNIFIVYCLYKKDVRKAFINVIKATFNKKLVVLYIFIYASLIFFIFILYKAKFWNINLLKDTIIWFITIPIFSIMRAQEDSEKYFKDTLKSCFEIYIIIEFIGVNYPFSLWIELIIIPTVLLLSLVGEFGEKFGGTKEASIFSYSIVIIISVISFVHSVRLIINDMQNVFTEETLKNIIYIPILTIIYMPITYLILVYMNYETFWVRINSKKYLSKRDKILVMCKALKKCKFNLNKVKKIKLEDYINIMER